MMSDKAVDAMLSSEFKLGADASVTVGPIGRGVEASRSTDLTSDIYAFSKSVGLFGGGALEGAKIFTRTSLNESYYGTAATRSEEHTSELQSLMRISYAVFCLKKKKQTKKQTQDTTLSI